jgi:hypothetical protein
MAVVAQLARPGFLGREHGVIEPHRKQHHAAAMPLLGERLGDLVLHPVAGDGRLRQHEQHLVPSGVNACTSMRRPLGCEPGGGASVVPNDGRSNLAAALAQATRTSSGTAGSR